jgi:mRNA interferase MazF
MKRGEIWWADLDAPAGQRPVLLLSRNEAYGVRELVTVAPVTTKIRNIRSEVPLGPEDGLPKACVANLDVIQTIDKNRLRERLTALTPQKIKAVEAALHFSLGFQRSTSF